MKNKKRYFSIVDVADILTESAEDRKYWNKLKQRLNEEGANELVTNYHQLKLKSQKDGKRYNTDVADTERNLRIIQSIPSKKAEPFKMWFAKVYYKNCLTQFLLCEAVKFKTQNLVT